jgi:hypothetical protein
MQIVSNTPSILSGDTARVYRFNCLERYHALRSHPNGKGVTFSFFARTISGSETLRVTLEGPFSSQTRDFAINRRWTRFELSLRNEISLQPLNIYFSTQIAVRPHSDLAIALPQTEEGLIATSPIPPDIPLPAISNDPGAVGSTRAAEQIWLDQTKTGTVIDSNSATAIITCKPIAHTDQIMDDDFLTFLSFWSSESAVEISVGISGKHGARFVVRAKENGKIEFVESSIIGGHQRYFVCVVFDRNALSIIINDDVAINTTLEQSVIFDRTYIACSHGDNPDNFNGHIQSYEQYTSPLLYLQILQIYRQRCPENPQHTYGYMQHYFKYALTTENEFSTFDSILNDKGYSYFIRQIDFAIPRIFSQFPPRGSFVESDVRDYVMALMQRPGMCVLREAYSNIGRTDLTLSYSSESYLSSLEGESTISVDQKYSIEFKIWGRKGYRKAPSQPLKYMSEDEKVGAFIMIDRRLSPEIKDFEDIVRNNTEFPCLSVKEIPVLESDLRYFVSFHIDPRYRTARMIINIFLPIVK